MRAAVLVLLVGCAPAVTTTLPADVPVETPRDQVRRYTIWLGGARVGTAVERETWTRDGVHLVRDEQLAFVRGDAQVSLATTIDIDASAALVARRVRWTEKTARDERAAEAVRVRDGGWQVSSGEHIATDAVPAELVPLIVRRDGAFRGDVFLPARGFVVGRGHIEAVAPGRLVARIALATATVEATIDIDRDGSPARIVDGEGVIAIRATEVQAAESFAPVDLISATAIPLTGRPGRSLLLDGDLALPALPGQQARPAPHGVAIELDARLPGDLPAAAADRDRTRDIRTLVTAVRQRITPDLSALTSRDALHATAGDCTTFALAYAALATQRQIPTRVVTGLRVDGPRLIRHRWAVSWTGTKWIAIDAAFGAVPAGGDLIGLAVHDADDAGLVAGEAALMQVRAARWQ